MIEIPTMVPWWSSLGHRRRRHHHRLSNRRCRHRIASRRRHHHHRLWTQNSIYSVMFFLAPIMINPFLCIFIYIFQQKWYRFSTEMAMFSLQLYGYCIFAFYQSGPMSPKTTKKNTHTHKNQNIEPKNLFRIHLMLVRFNINEECVCAFAINLIILNQCEQNHDKKKLRFQMQKSHFFTQNESDGVEKKGWSGGKAIFLSRWFDAKMEITIKFHKSDCILYQFFVLIFFLLFRFLNARFSPAALDWLILLNY